MKMKSTVKLLRAAALSAAACFALHNVSAQENITGDLFAGWAVNPISSGGGGTPPAPYSTTSGDANVTTGPLMKGSGIGSITTTNVYGGATWTNTGVADSEANSIANGLYITYTVQANAGYTISFTTNILWFHNSATGPISGELQYSTDGMNYTDISAMTYSSTHTAQTTSLTNVLSGVPALQNVPSSTINYFRIVNWGATGTAGTWYINNASPVTMPDFQVIGTISSTGVAPFNVSIAPSSIATNAGGTAAFTVTAQGDLPIYSWYKISGGSTNLVSGASAATLTLANLNGGNSGSYFAVLSNATGLATSPVVTLAVTDPFITLSPNSTYAVTGSTALFAGQGAGTSPAYQWYFSDSIGDIIAPVQNGTRPSGSTISGAATSELSIANVQPSDATNFVLVLSNAYGTATSSVASLVAVGTHEPLAFWNFNQLTFPTMLTNPAPWFGVGTASAAGSCYDPGTSPFAGSVEQADGPGFGLGLTNYSWGTDNYPASTSNKLNGVQFNVSTVGAQNIAFSYDSRVSATASEYERVQYTTNGTTWIDYPSSSSFNGVASSYLTFSNNLTGFPGVANNPNFGIRVVTEFQSTASYGFSTNAIYLGTANTYGTGGTITYDRVFVYGDSINAPYAPPTISSIPNTNTIDTTSLTLNFNVTDPSQSPDTLTYSAQSLNPATVSPFISFGGSGTNRTLTIYPNSTPDPSDYGPILVTVTDSRGFSAATWFILNLTSPNQPPTNSLTAVASTNTLVNTALTIPFKVTDDHTPTNGQNFTYSATSANSTVMPAGNIVVPNPGTNSNVSVTLSPAANELGLAEIGITVDDNDLSDPKTTTANIALMVRPNSNIVLIDYFNYDNGGPLDLAATNYWKHLTGTLHQMDVSVAPTGGFVTVDTVNNTENMQAPLFGGPFSTNSAGSLYASYIVNMSPTNLPFGNGTYFTTFNDGSGTSGPYECRVLAATNGAASGFYRIGIVNFGADATDGQMFPMDLIPGTNYVVVTSLVLSNGQSTVWVNPANQLSPSITDTTPNLGTNLYNIAQFELRESGGDGGGISLSQLKVGTTFDSVFPSLKIAVIGGNAVLTSSDPTLPIQAATSVEGPWNDVATSTPYTNALSSTMFYRFGQ